MKIRYSIRIIRQFWIAIFLIVVISTSGFSQSLLGSELVIEYDLVTHQTDKPIPFDKGFLLKLNKKEVGAVSFAELYQVNRKRGKIEYCKTNNNIVKDDTLRCIVHD